jgi:predicted RNA-binding protein Jag
MKSMLHEAASIIKAVEKAWTESGKPSEFTIKILEKGEKNFIGMTKRPAIISITYGFVGGGDKGNQRDFGKKDFGTNRSQNKQFPEGERTKFIQQKSVARDGLRNIVSEKPKQAQQKMVQEKQVNKKEMLPQDQDIQIWNGELINFCTESLKDLFMMLNFEYGCSTKVNNRLLTIMLDKPVSVRVEDLRLFYASISHLLLQFLKRKYKKKFNGFQIIINSTASNESPVLGKSN